VTRPFLVAAAVLVVAGCSDLFVPLPLPDLFKEPYDFSTEVPPYMGPGSDLAKESHDMAVPLD
jgi:hypothetical protein